MTDPVQQDQKPSAKRLPKILFLIVVVGLGVVGVRYYQKKQQVVGPPTFYGNVDIHDVTLAFRVGGRVAEVLKKEGDSVQPGEVVARIDAEPYRNALAQAQAAVDVAKAQLGRVAAKSRKEDLSEAKARLAEREAAKQRAEDTYGRVEPLAKAGAVTPQALDDARSALDQGIAGVTAAQAVLDRLINGSRSEDVAVARAQVAQAEAAMAAAELAVADTELRASAAGVVVTRAIEAGAMVGAGAPALVVAFQDEVWIRAFAPEAELGRLSPGTPVDVYSDFHPDQPYRGQVGYVAPQAEFTPKNVETSELRTSLVYRFRVVVTAHDGGLRQGMPVTVKVAADGAQPGARAGT